MLGQSVRLVIVSGQILPHVMKFYEKATQVFETLVSSVHRSEVNGIYTFIISPDGFKEGSQMHRVFNEKRDAFFAWVKEDARESGMNCDVVEIEYGIKPEIRRNL